jgi:hypothetical protein
VLNRIVGFLFFWRKENQPDILVVDDKTIGLPPVDKKEQAKWSEQAGQWYYLRDLLDRLDTQAKYVKRLKKDDPEAYLLYKNVGGYVVSDEWGTHIGSIEPKYKVDGLPSFGLMSWLLLSSRSQPNRNEEFYYPELVFFRKVKWLPNVEPYNGQIFRVGMYYFSAKKKNTGGMGFFYVGVGRDNKVKLLKEYTPHYEVIRSARSRKNGKRGPKRCKEKAVVTTYQWKLPRISEDAPELNYRSSQEFAETVFTLIANGVAGASGGIHVRATKCGVSSLFCIDMLRTPYFFKDRDSVVDEDGVKKKIFHIVRTHERVLKDGQKIYVKSHFRGLRKFSWNGYDITISVPGLHHPALNDLTSAAYDLPEDTPKEGWYSDKKFTKLVGSALAR